MSIFYFNDPVHVAGASFSPSGKAEKLHIQFYNGFRKAYSGKPCVVSVSDCHDDCDGVELEAVVLGFRLKELRKAK